MKRTLLCIFFALGGCSLADESLLDPLRDGGGVDPVDSDTEDMMVDAGPNFIASTCEATDTQLITETTTGIIVDTRDFSNTFEEGRNNFPACGLSTEGAEGFLRFRATAGAFWHFHLEPIRDLSTGPELTAEDARPSLYVVPPNCDARSITCEASSNVCSDNSDEHFGIRIPSNGDWHLAIDDNLPGGAVYRLSAYLVSCGDMDNSHGEACDDGVGGSDSCTSECHIIFGSEQSGGELMAISTTRAEATFLDDTSDPEGIRIVTPLGGNECSFPAVMAVRVDAPDGLSPQTLTVNNIDCEQGNFVDDGVGGEMDIATDAYQLDLFGAEGGRIGASISESFLGRDCAQIRFTPEEGSGNQLFFIEVRSTRPERQAPTLRVRTVVR